MGQEDGSSPEYNLSWERASSRLTFLVAGDDMVQAVGEALGYSWVSPSGKLRRWLPEYDPNFPWLVAKKLVPPYRGIRYERSEDPGTGYGPVNIYKKAQLTFEYGFRNFDEFSDADLDATYGGDEFFRYTTMTMTPAADYVSLAAGAVRWAPEASPHPLRTRAASDPDDPQLHTGPGALLPFSTGRVEYTQTVVYKWFQVPFSTYRPGSILDQVFQIAVGRVNKYDFDGFPAGTLLLESIQPEWVRAPTGEFYWNFEYHMK